jgi:lysophospholipid acyltransferase 1/2/lysophospholipid acyltransferase
LYLLSPKSVPSFVSAQVTALSEAIGFDEETLSYTLGMFLCYPLGLIMTLLPYGKVRHVFSFLLGAFLLQV